MSEIELRLVSALEQQLARREGTRVGWKLGLGDREFIGGHIAVGHLTSTTVLESGAVYRGEASSLHADALEVGPDGTIAAYSAALELVDLGRPPDTPDAVVAENVFHRAVVFGPSCELPAEGVTAGLVVNGEVRASGRAAEDLDEKLSEARPLGRARLSIA